MTPLVVAKASSSAPVAATQIDVPPAEVVETPAPAPPCERYWENWSLRGAMQTCSTWASLETNESWVFGVRAEVIDHRVVDVVLTNIDRDCSYCFEGDASDRAERARNTVQAVNQCMREQLASATFTDDTCTLDMGWVIKSDW